MSGGGQAGSAECERTYRRLIDELVLDELPSQKWERLRRHLAVCPACRARYDKAVLAERMLHGGPQAVRRPSPAELDRIAGAVFAAGGARPSFFARVVAWLAPTPRWATGLAAAAVVLLLPVLLRVSGRRGQGASGGGEGVEFHAGGAAGKKGVDLYSTQPRPKVERIATLRALCREGAAVRALDPTGPSAPSGSGVPSGPGATPPRCARAGQLELTVDNRGRFARLFLVGLDGEHQVKWYAPRPPRGESVEAPLPPEGAAEPVELPAGGAVRLDVNHRPGPVRIYALFSDQPVTAMEVEAARRELAARRVAIGSPEAETLPLSRPDVVQRSLLIDLVP